MHTAPHASKKLLGIATIVEMLERSRASIYRDIARDAFPKPLKLGRSSRWRASEVEAFIRGLADARQTDASTEE